MRKFYVMLFVAFISIVSFSSCNKCSNNKPQEAELVDSIVGLNVENVTNTNRQQMFTTYGEDYTWFETCVVLKDYIDSEDCNGAVESITNIFQVVTNKEVGHDTHVIIYNTTFNSTTVDDKHGFWLEDLPLNNEKLVLTFADAYEKLMEANVVKPHSKQVVLRTELGPVKANAQWIFGNNDAHVYVDAITGDVSTTSPAYPKQ